MVVSIFCTGDISNISPKLPVLAKISYRIEYPERRSKDKGDKRPVNNQEARALLLASLLFTDKIIFFDEDTPLELIRFIQPDILVKGSDYKPEEIVGYDIVKAKGGEIITIDLTPGFSTTSILQKL